MRDNVLRLQVVCHPARVGVSDRREKAWAHQPVRVRQKPPRPRLLGVLICEMSSPVHVQRKPANECRGRREPPRIERFLPCRRTRHTHVFSETTGWKRPNSNFGVRPTPSSRWHVLHCYRIRFSQHKRADVLNSATDGPNGQVGRLRLCGSADRLVCATLLRDAQIVEIPKSGVPLCYENACWEQGF